MKTNKKTKKEECLIARNCCGSCSICKPIGDLTKTKDKVIRIYGTEYIAID